MQNWIRDHGLLLANLALLFFVLFFASIAVHAFSGAAVYNSEELQHSGHQVSIWQYLGASQFWFESFQNWQSEFSPSP